MFELRDLFQWERFITPSIIKIFYWLAVGLTLLAGLSGVISGVGLLLYSPIAGFITVLVSILATLAGVIIARISAEFILIVFRINEHLGAIRNQRGM
jgi:uncharacterized protein DUF4282